MLCFCFMFVLEMVKCCLGVGELVMEMMNCICCFLVIWNIFLLVGWINRGGFEFKENIKSFFFSLSVKWKGKLYIKNNYIYMYVIIKVCKIYM